jgi:hypothetical protein
MGKTETAIARNGKAYKLIGASGSELDAEDSRKIYESQGCDVIIEKETKGIFRKRYRWLHYVFYAKHQEVTA